VSILLDSAQRSASVVILEKNRLAVISKSTFEQCMEKTRVFLLMLAGDWLVGYVS